MNANKEKPILFSIPLICKENNSKDTLVGEENCTSWVSFIIVFLNRAIYISTIPKMDWLIFPWWSTISLSVKIQSQKSTQKAKWPLKVVTSLSDSPVSLNMLRHRKTIFLLAKAIITSISIEASCYILKCYKHDQIIRKYHPLNLENAYTNKYAANIWTWIYVTANFE